ncbi:hypothetical protein SAMN05421827_109105 [Pedobacter terrae]|uniref:Uncharacterized protein n=1 Tax=Pedobacter terrae TaxID=405671 RepID=A0A1G7W583_9SPHI|nr:hypothetical protein [Pedobacter terrae]SDG67134.1 hypothetical protein SAMN05421827_109105 [Pedobacter terrae]
MPKITRLADFDFSVENFLDACSPAELREVDLLIQSNRYRNKMNAKTKKLTNTADEKDKIEALGFNSSFLLGENKQ